jgi:hypothetical protein
MLFSRVNSTHPEKKDLKISIYYILVPQTSQIN